MSSILLVLTGATDWKLNDGSLHPTGFWAEEFVAAHREFAAAGANVAIATPGGSVPVADELSLSPEMNGGDLAKIADLRAYLAEKRSSLAAPLVLEDVDPAAYDAIFLPGGHGPMEDLARSEAVGQLLVAMLDGPATVVGSVVTGPPASSPRAARAVRGHSTGATSLPSLTKKRHKRVSPQRHRGYWRRAFVNSERKLTLVRPGRAMSWSMAISSPGKTQARRPTRPSNCCCCCRDAVSRPRVTGEAATGPVHADQPGWARTAFASLLDLRYPIIQGPFGGGGSTVDLSAAVSAAGGLGSFGAYLLPPADLDSTIADLQRRIDGPFAVNLWVPTKSQPKAINEATREAGLALLRTWYTRFGLPEPELPGAPLLPDYDAQVQIVLERRPPVFSFVFGVPSARVLRECRRRGIVTVGAATNLDEGRALEAAGVDVIVASGIEAGGHRPSFLGVAADSIATGPLTAHLRSTLAVPVVAAGGIADGRGVVSAIAMGAAGVQIGTAFLATNESGVHGAHRDALFSQRARYTTPTRVMSGRLARSIRTEFIDSMSAVTDAVPDYPQQLWLTGPLRSYGATTGNPEMLSLWAGQGAPLLRGRGGAAELVEFLVADTSRVLADLAALSS